MPLNIIRNDITRVSADAIVNTANPQVAIGAGVDQAIYEAAGVEQLLAERAKIGPMRPGQATVTPSFGLDAKYIIHTVGPVWQGGDYGEREAVASCYRESLRLAADLECGSIAFPLISTGTYGFPKDEALKIAISEISSFLFSHDMTVYMVVYSREAFVISSKAFSDIKCYIEDKDVKPQVYGASGYNRRRRLRDILLPREERDLAEQAHAEWDRREEDREAGAPKEHYHYKRRTDPRESFFRPPGASKAGAGKTAEQYEAEKRHEAEVYEAALYDAEVFEDASLEEEELCAGSDAVFSIYEGAGLDDVLNRESESFQQMLFRIIDRQGMTDPEVYKKANLDRKLFSKIRSSEDYLPKKKTVLALAIALELNMDETIDLLRRAGIALNPNSRFDLIVGYCIDHKIYNIFDINTYLFEYDQPLLGA